jgi:muconolactone delta-isomerase
VREFRDNGREHGRTLDKETLAMEYLVTMTTHVPDGISDETVQATRDKEAARSAQLAAQGHLLRLWRPPLRPGEWRTLGLFAAQDGTELEAVLKSMPLRVWRRDEVTPLSPHPNDPAPGAGAGQASAGQNGAPPGPPATGGAKEFLTNFHVNIPDGTPPRSVDDTEAREARAAHQLAQQGHLERLWTLPSQTGHGQALGLWRSQDEAEMKAIVDGLPLSVWMSVDITALSPHPSDPVLLSSHGRE